MIRSFKSTKKFFHARLCVGLFSLFIGSLLSSRLQAQSTSGASSPATDSFQSGPVLQNTNRDPNQPSNQSNGAGTGTGAPLGNGESTVSSISSNSENGSGTATPLSTDQILNILQEQPDALIELKSFAADLAQQQGTPVQPDSITDEMLYNKIASSPELRASITTFLRARGYVTDSDIAGMLPDANEGSTFSR